MSPETLSSSLGALKELGSIFGLFLSHRSEILFQEAPFSSQRVTELSETLEDIANYFEQEGREPDQLVFGYDGGSLLILIDGDFRLALFFHTASEVDILAQSASAFFKDFCTSVVIEHFIQGHSSKVEVGGREGDASARISTNTERIAARAKAPVEPTSPIKAIP